MIAGYKFSLMCEVKSIPIGLSDLSPLVVRSNPGYFRPTFRIIASSPSILPCLSLQSAKPQWDESFAFELVAPAFAVLKLKVMDHMRCWRPRLLGEVSPKDASMAEWVFCIDCKAHGQAYTSRKHRWISNWPSK